MSGQGNASTPFDYHERGSTSKAGRIARFTTFNSYDRFSAKIYTT